MVDAVECSCGEAGDESRDNGEGVVAVETGGDFGLEALGEAGEGEVEDDGGEGVEGEPEGDVEIAVGDGGVEEESKQCEELDNEGDEGAAEHPGVEEGGDGGDGEE